MFQGIGFWLLSRQVLDDGCLWIHPFLRNLVESIQPLQNLFNRWLEWLDVLKWAEGRDEQPEDDCRTDRCSESGNDSAQENHSPTGVLFDLLSEKLVLFSEQNDELFLFSGLGWVRHFDKIWFGSIYTDVINTGFRLLTGIDARVETQQKSISHGTRNMGLEAYIL